MVDDFEGGQLRMHYLDEGPEDGPTLILLQGNPTWTYLFREIIPLLNAAGYRTLAVDYIGMGRSDKPTQWEDYTYDRHVQWVKQWFDQVNSTLNLGQVSIIGHDYGTPIGIRLMNEYYPNRFDSFVDMNASLPDGDYISPTHLNWRQFVRDNPDVPIGHVISSQVDPSLSADEINAYYAPYPTVEYKMAMRTFPEMVPESPDWPEAIANLAAWQYMEGFQKPFMTIFGTFDAADVPSARMEFIDRVPGAYGQPHPQLQVTHYAPEDRPQDVAAAVIDFLNDVYDEFSYKEIVKVNFDNGFDGFVDGGSNCEYDATKKSIRLSGNLGQASSTQKELGEDAKQAAVVRLAFRYVANQFNTGDQLIVEFGNGQTWQTVLSLKAGIDFVNGAEDYGFVKITGDEIDFKDKNKIRLRSASTSAPGAIHLLDVGVYARERVITSIVPERNTDIQVYPNPFSNQFHVQVRNMPGRAAIQYSIFNLQGIAVASGILTQSDGLISMEQLAAGVYWIRVADGTNKYHSVRIIKK
jgi:haloalkane dehalogenase